MSQGIQIKLPGKSSQNSIVSKIGVSLFFSIFLAMGLAFAVMITWGLLKTLATYWWQETPCTILTCSIVDDFDDESPYAIDIAYQYEFNDKSYTSSTYQLNNNGSSDYAEVGSLANQYRPKSQAICYVNPDQPDQAILTHKSLWEGLFIFLPLIFVIVGGGGIYFTWRKTDPEKKEVKSSKSQAAKSTKVGLIFFAVFGLVGLGVLFPFFIIPLSNIINARSWQETPCKIISTNLRSHSDDDGTTYSIDILYEYQFNNQTYRSNRYSFSTGSSSGSKGKRAVIKSYRTAKNPTCYVNPDAPSQAVLNREMTWSLLFGLIPLVFLIVGITGIYYTLRKSKTNSKSSQAPQWHPASSKAGSQNPDYSLIPHQPHTITLKPDSSKVKNILGVTFFALFWNGIISVFLFEVVEGFSNNDPDWFLTIFMIPFVLVGIGSIIGVCYSILTLFNAKPILTLTPGRIPIGTAGELSWIINGRVDSVQNLTITLNGREEVTYRQGTSTRTDKSTFYDMELFSTNSSSEMYTGQVGFLIPQETMHSFEADNNKIIWSIMIKGDIKRWPDIDSKFTINVLPAEISKEQ
ncbi:MAG: DUF3592 domain-containing protein [Phycisphaerae bacterium]|nr:DUF3592 domain-containing protein [Phycisphaerae bacterium]